MHVALVLIAVLVPIQASAQLVATSFDELQPPLKQTSSTPIRDAAHSEAVRLAGWQASQAAPSAQKTAPQRIWPARHPILVGTLIGSGIGLGYLAAEGCGSSDYSCSGLAAFFGGTGAGLGALGGAAVAIILR